MIKQQKNLGIIHNCEELFSKWLKARLENRGIPITNGEQLSELLINYEHELANLKQQIKPLQKWNKIREECVELKTTINGGVGNDEHLSKLIEKTAFEGQILWLTFQDD